MEIINLKLVSLFFVSFLWIDSFKLFFCQIKADELDSYHNNESAIYFKDLYYSKIIYENKTRKLEKYLLNDLLKSGNNFIDLLSLNNKSEKKDFSLEIESNTQYEKDNVYYAEGNAVIYFSNATLSGEKIIYDKSKKTITILGDITFFKGNQYFEASKVFYDFKNKNGYIDDAYGIIDFNSSIVDFEFKNIKKKDERVMINQLSNLRYIDDVSVGLVNNFESKKKLM